MAAAAAAAAATLRYAVTRLGGCALQRPQRYYNATADDIQSGRTVRPTSSRRSGSSTCAKHANAKPVVEPLGQKNKEYLASTQQKEIDNKKEELFHLIAKMDRELPSHCNIDNRQLLMQLSIFVQPKPNDPNCAFIEEH